LGAACSIWSNRSPVSPLEWRHWFGDTCHSPARRPRQLISVELHKLLITGQ